MRTDELIHALAEDVAVKEREPARTLALGVVVGAVLAGLVFAILLRPRPGIVQVADDLRFLFKFVEGGTLALAGVAICASLMRPSGRLAGRAWLLAVPLGLLLVAVITELLVLPQQTWGARLIGVNWMYCLAFIPVIAVAPLAALLMAMRHGAPSRPELAGAIAGLSAGGIAAFFYALHCPDDSPLFVATWYMLAIAAVTAAGAFAGRRYLRW
ncbi:MAG: hypothetical protein JWL62_3213 [Hyphomicrobiales bacterium]|nr:hypothetical protein [Hyphomicrobiales bacterium]